MGKELKKIGFNEAGSIRNAKIEIEGCEAFDISFKIPGNAARIAIAMILEKDESTVGKMVLNFISEHLVSWTLPAPVSRESLDQLDNDAVFYAIFKAIQDAGGKRKN